jgi:hypothetical protein
MSIPNYGKKLIKDGELVAEPVLLYPHDFYKVWTPDFMESITFVCAAKGKYTSALCFFWQTIFHAREVMSQTDAEEIFTSTHLYKVTLQEAKDKIKQTDSQWFDEHKDLIPNAKWSHIIWNDENDIFIIFEDEEMYYGWGWDCTL